MISFRPLAPVILLSLFEAAGVQAEEIKVDITPGHGLNRFRPARTLGAGVDRLPPNATDVLLAPETLKQVLAAGWGTVTYRLNTELHVEAWHWNPRGKWSEPGGGYFVGDSQPGPNTIHHSYASPLPHRGVTRNEGTENEGYSRLDDGDPATYWKSNPYLERPFTGEDDATFPPQWVVIDVGSAQVVDTLRIAWAAPFARRYRVEAWKGEADALKEPAKGSWTPLTVEQGNGGVITTRFPATKLRFLRVTLHESSQTCDSHGAGDRRNCLGYAIGEVYLGTGEGAAFKDLLHHSPDQHQSATTGSSVDPWHAPSDASIALGDQVGLDFFYGSGVTRGLPAMIPVAVLYGTPEDAVAEISYLQTRRYPISHVELGEEADGQYMTPEHYGALYLQFAAALRKLDPRLPLGGPVFASWKEDVPAWPDASGDSSWLGRFVKYLERHGRMGDLDFMSFEHYPYDVCKSRWEDLYEEPHLIGHIMDVYRKDGLPPRVPLLATEVNLAWQAGERFVDLFGALWLADYTGSFLGAGGTATYFFHYLPLPLGKACDGTRGTFGMHFTDAQFKVQQPLAQYFAGRMVTREWVQFGDREHELFPADSGVLDAEGHTVVTAYPVLRPDRRWALLLVNKDRDRAHEVAVSFRDEKARKSLAFKGPVELVTFGPQQYAWHGDETQARPDGPPRTRRWSARPGERFSLPAASVSVLRGKLGPAPR
jgi:hypothetical protein